MEKKKLWGNLAITAIAGTLSASPLLAGNHGYGCKNAKCHGHGVVDAKTAAECKKSGEGEWKDGKCMSNCGGHGWVAAAKTKEDCEKDGMGTWEKRGKGMMKGHMKEKQKKKS